jgi:hypothetical protein
VIAGHPEASTTFQFYEEIDHWLGPWGKTGYPIAYGKFYNVAFTTNAKLMANPTTKQWVWKTTILLQQAIRDYVAKRVEDCTIGAITEGELRAAAFASHPQSYDKGGLAMVCLTAPELVPVIATIPSAEFNPASDNFWPTVKQVFDTVDRVLPEMTGNALAAAAGPAHTGIFSRAVDMDQRRFFQEQAIGRELSDVKNAIQRGDLDNIPVLDKLIAKLDSTEFPDMGFARMAKDVVDTAKARRSILVNLYNELLKQSPEVKGRIDLKLPNSIR